ncbi:hypothetical protein [Rhodococcus sp. NCIMB 12038]|uniref:hypothetical protein n=1 Tax=Rhodococcus sp. NCIMB 12038 TaxID=933800 RepID=UPI000B3CB91F|nr:hypothetical protein [Rhodococcus sp. NCIMB 12038]OUS97302.1 hypothetical protein CA951_02855 [Rhodococcus sp. NCIMB 12038]
MYEDDDYWERLIFEAEKFQRDLEVHTLNLKLYHSQSEHWRAKAWTVLWWYLLFVTLTGIFMSLALLELFNGHQSSWWLAGGYPCSLISFVLVYIHHRHLKRSKAASEKFRSLEPPASLRPLMASIDAEIEAEERAAATAKKRRRWLGRRPSQHDARRRPGRLGHS